jgi:hypothetical protein
VAVETHHASASIRLTCLKQGVDGRDMSAFTRVVDALCPAMTTQLHPKSANTNIVVWLTTTLALRMVKV